MQQTIIEFEIIWQISNIWLLCFVLFGYVSVTRADGLP